MEIELTKDAENMILSAYSVYLQRIKNGMDKRRASDFSDIQYLQSELFPTWPMPDILSTAVELGRAGLVKYYMREGFYFLDSGIIFCEKHFGNTLEKVLDVISKLKP